MKYLKLTAVLFINLLLLNSCKEEVDKEKPTISIDFEEAFPQNCDTIYFGESFTLKVLFADNAELGSVSAFSIDIHHNFDQHSHSTEVVSCDMDDEKKAVNPWVFIESFDIQEGINEYETSLLITVPDSDSEGKFDEGDYHFFISLTDKEGWSAQLGLSIKMLYRE